MGSLRLLHLSGIHLGSTTRGRIDPASGENTRGAGFARSLTLYLDRAIAEPADLVLFGGNAFPDATPPPKVQQLFAGQFRRLADANIPTVLLGERTTSTPRDRGASLTIYRSLGVPGLIVGDRPDLWGANLPYVAAAYSPRGGAIGAYGLVSACAAQLRDNYGYLIRGGSPPTPHAKPIRRNFLHRDPIELP